MVFVFLNSPVILIYTGPDCTYSPMSPKLNASIERIDSFYGLLDKRYLATSFLGSEFNLYSSIFFLVSRLQNPISTIEFQYMKFILFSNLLKSIKITIIKDIWTNRSISIFLKLLLKSINYKNKDNYRQELFAFT